MIISAHVLAYYDVTKPVVIQCDASKSGLSAALLQEGRPVAFSSRMMSQTEHNYAQIEKELLAIVFACEKFDQYIFGRSDATVVVESDHRPLETIFEKPKLNSPKRLQRMPLRLQNYDIQVEYKRRTAMFLADTLSRAYLENEPEKLTPQNDIRSMKKRVFALALEQIRQGEDVSVSPVRLKRLLELTAGDEELQILTNVIGDGSPETVTQARKFDRRQKQVI